MATRVCIAGLGRRGLDQLETLAAHPDEWEIVGVSDRSPAAHARLQALHYELRIPFVRDAADLMLFDPELVLVSTTAPGHVPVALDVLGAGYAGALLIEKPLASSVAAARALAEAARKSRAAVCFQRRCSSMYADAVAAAHELGPVRTIAISSSSPEPLGMSGSHEIDLAGWFAGASPTSVSAHLSATAGLSRLGTAFVDPPGELEVAYANGVTAAIDLTGTAGREGAGLGVVCAGGAIRIPRSEEHAVAGDRTIPADGGMVEWFEATVRALVRAEDRQPCTLAEGVDGLEVIAGAFLSSSRGGEPVALPLGAEDATRELPIA